MSDETNAPGTPSPEPPAETPAEQPSWSAPPNAGTPPPPPPDATGAVPAPSAGVGINLSLDNPAALVLALIAIVGVILGLLLKSTQNNLSGKLWDTMGWTWAVLAIVAAAATLLPAINTMIKLPAKVAWEVAAVASGILSLWWVLFVLPYVQANTAFLATAGVLGAIGVVWRSQPTDDAVDGVAT